MQLTSKHAKIKNKFDFFQKCGTIPKLAQAKESRSKTII